ncbi:hypothetical protein LTS18_012525 [Coniosporium uncinatum]|uniref:Uncharacterized protein n=1 Tax=Coniosporium uncinatum TaxID=93489 RepID=A0ACC3DJC6_9PEZI|nr:hypothetical protein LTS18_012525 [Coniosporium uncinatum]
MRVAQPVEEAPLVNWTPTVRRKKYERRLLPGLTPKKKPEEMKGELRRQASLERANVARPTPKKKPEEKKE